MGPLTDQKRHRERPRIGPRCSPITSQLIWNGQPNPSSPPLKNDDDRKINLEAIDYSGWSSTESLETRAVDSHNNPRFPVANRCFDWDGQRKRRLTKGHPFHTHSRKTSLPEHWKATLPVFQWILSDPYTVSWTDKMVQRLSNRTQLFDKPLYPYWNRQNKFLCVSSYAQKTRNNQSNGSMRR
ncbi:unnamed protein product [Caenorhabditis nigoni]